jgi:hypothetical protein
MVIGVKSVVADSVQSLYNHFTQSARRHSEFGYNATFPVVGSSHDEGLDTVVSQAFLWERCLSCVLTVAARIQRRIVELCEYVARIA